MIRLIRLGLRPAPDVGIRLAGRPARMENTSTSCSALPPEILDLVVDHLGDDSATLKTCCLVSKSWISRARLHLFAHVEFDALKCPIGLWTKAFPDPSNSPAHHTRSLSIRGIPVVTATDTGASGWIRTFHGVVSLHLTCLGHEDRRASLVPFHGLSPTLRSLRLTLTRFDLFYLICSFPLLEDLAFSPFPGGGADGWNVPSMSPKLNGSLYLGTVGGVRSVTSRLLDLPDGLHFSSIAVLCLNEDLKSATDLVSACSGNLESLSVHYWLRGMLFLTSMVGKYLTVR